VRVQKLFHNFINKKKMSVCDKIAPTVAGAYNAVKISGNVELFRRVLEGIVNLFQECADETTQELSDVMRRCKLENNEKAKKACLERFGIVARLEKIEKLKERLIIPIRRVLLEQDAKTVFKNFQRWWGTFGSRKKRKRKSKSKKKQSKRTTRRKRKTKRSKRRKSRSRRRA